MKKEVLILSLLWVCVVSCQGDLSDTPSPRPDGGEFVEDMAAVEDRDMHVALIDADEPRLDQAPREDMLPGDDMDEPFVDESGVFVAMDGDDANLGTWSAPLATLEEARSRIRLLPEQGPRTVYMRGGTYRRTSAFTLEEEDAGSPSSPIIYRAFREETVVLSGGLSVKADELERPGASILARLPDASRDGVFAIDLKALGTSLDAFGRIRYWQLGKPLSESAQGALFVDGEKFELARYPRQDEGPGGDGFLLTGAVTHVGAVPRYGTKADPEGGIFAYTDPIVETWQEPTQVWMYGYWKHDYADGTLRVKAIDPSAGTIAAEQASWYGIAEGSRYYYFNVVEELREPGDYAIDERAGSLYFVSSSPPKASTSIQLSLLNEPLVHIQGADHVEFHGIDFALTRDDAVRVEAASHVVIEDFVIARIQGRGIVMPTDEVYGNTIRRGEMSGLGGACFVIGGGDRLTQKPGMAVVEDMSCTQFGLESNGRSVLRGVGNTVRHCAFSQSNTGAIGFGGNAHIIEYNTFSELNLTASDSGTVYLGRDPTDAGNVVRFNYFEKIGNELTGTGVQGVYIDDRSSFLRVHGNIFNHVGSGAHAAAFKANGGKHTTFEHNIVVGERAAYIQVHSDEAWSSWYEEASTQNKLAVVGYPDAQSPWAQLYPEAFALVGRSPQAPRSSNVLRQNIVLDAELVWGIVEGRYADPEPLKEGNWLIDEDPGFANAAAGDFSLSREEMARQFPGFEWIDFARIGPR